MGRKSIPNWRRANSRTSTRLSKRSRRNCDGQRPGAHLDTATNGENEWRSAGLRHGASGLGSCKGAVPEAGVPVAVSSCARRPGSGACRSLGRIEGKTSNIQHPTSNTQRNGMRRRRCRFPAIGCWALEVGCSTFCAWSPRRVMGAWWPSRSSKPLSARSTSRGMFDSYPLRHFHFRFAIFDSRFEEAARKASAPAPLVNRKSQIVNPEKGGGPRDTRKNS